MTTLGFDIGGSHIAGGLFNERYERLRTLEEPFPKGRPDDVPALVASMAKRLCEGVCPARELDSVGLAVPGSINRARTHVLNAYNLGFHDLPLPALVSALLDGTPVYLGNDADSAALAELQAGAFRGVKSAVLFTLGTGVGGGVILNGKLFLGGMGNGVELGHFILDLSGHVCTCGVRGCCETRCSATALIREGKASVSAHPQGLIARRAKGSEANVNARLVIDAARENDPAALAIFHAYVDALGSAAASVINILDPEVIAFGGGVSGAGEFLFAPLRENVKQKSFYDSFARIVPAQLGNDAGMLGAALLKKDAEG